VSRARIAIAGLVALASGSTLVTETALAAGSATITKVTYEATQPSPPASCSALPSTGGSGSESYDTPDGARKTTWEWTIPATVQAGTTAHIKVTSQAVNNGGASDAIAIKPPSEFGLTPSTPNQVIASVPPGAPDTDSAEQSYKFEPTRDFVTGEKLVLRIEIGCANFIYEYTGKAAAPSASGCYLGKKTRAAECPALPLTPSTTRPHVGRTTSYAAPESYTDPVSLPAPTISPRAHGATVDIAMSRDHGKLLSDEDFLATISDENIVKGAKVCGLLLLEVVEVNTTLDEDVAAAQTDQYVHCVMAVAQILQRAEAHRQSQTARTAAAAGCHVKLVRLKGARGASPVKVTCRATPAGVRLSIRPAHSGTRLRAALGRSPRLVIGRLRTAQPVRARDRVNVRWTTS
jgi:hypothetical protein